MKVYGIFGDPVSHSLSPKMHNAAFAHCGLNAVYVPFHVLPTNLESAVSGLRSLNIQGINVTVPHKETILPFLDEVDPVAQQIGAVNTILLKDGRLIGTNTDGLGFLKSIESWEPPKSALILGAGGSARAILVALAQQKIPELCIANRTPERANELLETLQPWFPETTFRTCLLSEAPHQKTDLLVNTTTVGMDGQSQPVDLSSFENLPLGVVDIIYGKAATPLLKEAEENHILFQDGRGMLLHQGAEAFRYWTGVAPPISVMSEVLSS